MKNITLLIDSSQFWEQFKKDTQTAEKNIYIQTLSFEGDSIGQNLHDELKKSTATDIRIISDTYINYIINDLFIFSPKNIFNTKLQAEVKATKKLITSFKKNDIKVKILNPSGLPLIKMIDCDHKKIIQIDDKISYLGGINFCEHNFLWHDLMIRIEDKDIADYLKQDFLATWEENRKSRSKKFKDLTIDLTDGPNNKNHFKKVINLINKAEKSIFVESPYITFPYHQSLRKAKRRGVEINIIAPEHNNKKTIGEYIKWESNRSGFNLYLYQNNMTHLKALLIDEETLILGSSNFDYLSYQISKETILFINNKNLINEFKEKVIKKDLANSVKYTGQKNNLTSWFWYLIMKLLGYLSVRLARIKI